MSEKNLIPFKEIQEFLKDKRLYEIGKKTGLTYPTLKKLSDGITEGYALKTLSVISKYIRNYKK